MWGYTAGMIFLDTETHDISGARLVELCYWVEGVQEPVVLRCKPPVPIDPGASAVNHITNKMVEMLLPFKEQACYAEIKELLENDTIVAHNAIFDVSVLWHEGIEVNDFICTKSLAQRKWPNAPKHNLQYLRYWLGLEVEAAAHTSEGDVRVLRALWGAIN